MRRRFMGLAACFLALFSTARGQTPAEIQRTAAYIASLQNPDGGFGATRGGASSLGATSSGVRQLKNVAGSIPDVLKCNEYVKSCFDPRTGGFVQTPGGTGDVPTTASGLMAVGSLKIATPAMIDGAIGYFSKEVKTFEQIRIAVAGLEAVNKPSPDFPRWIEQVKSDRNEDGTWGKDDARARATGSAAVALLRMGVDLEKKDAVIAFLKSAQKADGGWSPDGGASNLDSTYRIMRYFFMTKQKPNLDTLRSYLASHRRDDGSYASKPGGTDAGGTYYCTTIGRWARLLSGEPAVVETAGFVPLFNGKDLDGWEGDTQLWTARDGMIVGTSPGLKYNDFLATTKNYQDFILKFTFRLTGDEKSNSGAQFRSVRLPGHEMSGYQADIGNGYWGSLYDESRRNKSLVPSSDKIRDAVHMDGWNSYSVRCMGDHITLSLNGMTTADYVEKDAGIARDGKIAFQIHAGGPMRIEIKDAMIQALPIPTADDADTPGFHLRTLKAGEGAGRKYSVFLPNDFDPAKTYPVVLFLHGSGERGSDGIASAQIGLGAIIAKDPVQFPIIAVFPQAKTTWAADSADMKAALAALDEVESRYKIDRNREYLTGLSMGGFGTWGLAALMPDRFAAISPVCGFGNPDWAAKVKNLPIWTFVGDDDSPMILNGTRTLVDKTKADGGSPKLTEFRAVGHNSWDRTYSDPQWIAWFLSQRK